MKKRKYFRYLFFTKLNINNPKRMFHGKSDMERLLFYIDSAKKIQKTQRSDVNGQNRA